MGNGEKCTRFTLENKTITFCLQWAHISFQDTKLKAKDGSRYSTQMEPRRGYTYTR